MLHGNLSNRCAPVILIRVDNFLLKYKNKGIKNKILNKIFSSEERAQVDNKVFGVLMKLFMKTDYTAHLITDTTHYNESLLKKLEKEKVPYSRIHVVERPVDIALLLNAGYEYYVDDNINRIKEIGHTRCITLEDLDILVRGGSIFNV